MKRLMSALLMSVMAIVFCVPAFAVDTATTEQTEPVVFKSNTLPDWFPEDAPAPDPQMLLRLILMVKLLQFIGMLMKTVIL